MKFTGAPVDNPAVMLRPVSGLSRLSPACLLFLPRRMEAGNSGVGNITLMVQVVSLATSQAIPAPHLSVAFLRSLYEARQRPAIIPFKTREHVPAASPPLSAAGNPEPLEPSSARQLILAAHRAIRSLRSHIEVETSRATLKNLLPQCERLFELDPRLHEDAIDIGRHATLLRIDGGSEYYRKALVVDLLHGLRTDDFDRALYRVKELCTLEGQTWLPAGEPPMVDDSQPYIVLARMWLNEVIPPEVQGRLTLSDWNALSRIFAMLNPAFLCEAFTYPASSTTQLHMAKIILGVFYHSYPNPDMPVETVCRFAAVAARYLWSLGWGVPPEEWEVVSELTEGDTGRHEEIPERLRGFFEKICGQPPLKSLPPREHVNALQMWNAFVLEIISLFDARGLFHPDDMPE